MMILMTKIYLNKKYCIISQVSLFFSFYSMQSIFELEKEEDLYSILGCVDSSSVRLNDNKYQANNNIG